MDIIDMIRVDKEQLTPEEYLLLRKKNSNSIKHTRIIPARLGEKGFGKIEVTYKSAKYVAG